MNSKPIGPFLGINTRLPDYSLGTKDGRYVRSAHNVDLTNSGTFVRRKAYQQIKALIAPHSIHTNHYVQGSALYSFTDPTTATFVKTLASNDLMSYAEFDNSVYFSNGTDSGRIAADGTIYPWGLPTLAEPIVTAMTGTMFKGWYQVALSYYNATTGEEGGVSPSCNFELTTVGGLTVALPGPTTGATHVNIYVSGVNGSLPCLVASVPTSTASYIVSANSLTGREAVQRYEAPLPAGTRVFMYNGRLCSVAGDTLYIGIPYRPGYYLPVEGYIRFPTDIGIAIGNQNGLYISADKTYFIAGADLSGQDTKFNDVLPYGAVPGTEFIVPDKENITVGWFGAKGFVLADAQGLVGPVMSEAIAEVAIPASGVSVVMETNGIRRVISCGWCMNLSNHGLTTYDWDFASVHGSYATGGDGIYQLGGTGSVASSIGLGNERFGSENEKFMPAIYLGCRSDLPMTVSLQTPTSDVCDYTARSCSDNLNIHRVDPGKGLRGNWFDITIGNQEGSDFELASVSFAQINSTRKV